MLRFSVVNLYNFIKYSKKRSEDLSYTKIFEPFFLFSYVLFTLIVMRVGCL